MSTPQRPAAVPPYLEVLRRHSRRNAVLFYLDGFFFLFGFSLIFPSTILAGYVDHISSTATAASTLTLLFLVGIGLPQPIGCYISHRRERRRGLVVCLVVLQKVPILGLALLSLAAGSSPQIVLILTYVLFGAFMLIWGVTAPIWNDWIGRVLDPETRGHTLGMRTFWMSLGGLLGALVSGVALEGTEGIGTYTKLFFAAFCVTSLSVPCLASMHEADYPVPTRVLAFWPFMRRLVGVLREHREFRRYVLASTLFFGTAIVPGVAIWVAQERFAGFAEAGWSADRAAGRWNVAMCVVQVLFGLGIARFAQRHGPRPALIVMGLASVAMPLVAILAPGPLTFSGVFIAFGIFQSAFFVAHLGTLYSLVPGEDRLPYFAVSELPKVPLLVVAMLGGSWLIDRASYDGIVLVLACSALAPIAGLLLLPSVARERSHG